MYRAYLLSIFTLILLAAFPYAYSETQLSIQLYSRTQMDSEEETSAEKVVAGDAISASDATFVKVSNENTRPVAVRWERIGVSERDTEYRSGVVYIDPSSDGVIKIPNSPRISLQVISGNDRTVIAQFRRSRAGPDTARLA